MKRKVIRQGNNTLTITLPREWTTKHSIAAGGEIEMTMAEKSLILDPPSQEGHRSISLNVDTLGRLCIAKLLIACYEQGYDTITLTFRPGTISSWSHGDESITDVINFFTARLIGFEVLSQSERSLSITNISEQFSHADQVIYRIFFLLKEYVEQGTHALSDAKSDLEMGESRHDAITKFVALASRIILNDGARPKNDAMHLFVIFQGLDKAADFIRYVYRNAKDQKIAPGVPKVMRMAEGYLELYHQFYYKFSLAKINELDRMRGEMKDQCRMLARKGQNPEIVMSIDAFVETIHGIIKPKIAMETKTF